jgi:hypothetical protein
MLAARVQHNINGQRVGVVSNFRIWRRPDRAEALVEEFA